MCTIYLLVNQLRVSVRRLVPRQEFRDWLNTHESFLAERLLDAESRQSCGGVIFNSYRLSPDPNGREEGCQFGCVTAIERQGLCLSGFATLRDGVTTKILDCTHGTCAEYLDPLAWEGLVTICYVNNGPDRAIIKLQRNRDGILHRLFRGLLHRNRRHGLS